nr:hypothetical protein GCM10020093_119610 [Planobispora longispora]
MGMSGTGSDPATTTGLLAAMAGMQPGYGAAASDSNPALNLPQVPSGAADGLGTGLYDPAQAYVRTIQSAMNGIG